MTPRPSRMLFVIGAILTLPRCDSPTLTSAEEGITVFADRNYSGKSLTLDADIRNFEHLRPGPCDASSGGTYPGDAGNPGHWGDCISSIRVPAGWTATAFVDDTYRGRSLDLTEDIPDLRRVTGPCGEGFNDCISSMRISRR